MGKEKFNNTKEIKTHIENKIFSLVEDLENYSGMKVSSINVITTNDDNDTEYGYKTHSIKIYLK